MMVLMRLLGDSEDSQRAAPSDVSKTKTTKTTKPADSPYSESVKHAVLALTPLSPENLGESRRIFSWVEVLNMSDEWYVYPWQLDCVA